MLLQDIQRERHDAKEYTLKQKLLQSVMGFVRGPIQAYLQVNHGFLGSSLGAMGILAVSTLGNHFGFSAQRRNVVNVYRDEIAIALNKERESINEADMEQLARMPAYANSPIARDVSSIKKNERAVHTKTLFKNLAISASVIPFAMLVAETITVGMIGYAIIGAMSSVIDILAENMLEKWQGAQQPTAASFIGHIRNEMTKGSVEPAKLFEYAVHARPEIAQAVRSHTNEEYSSLSFEKKNLVIEKLGFSHMVEAIARDLNHGTIRPSELPFLLVGMDSPSTSFSSYKNASKAFVAPSENMAAAKQQSASQPNSLIHSVELGHTLAHRQALAHTL